MKNISFIFPLLLLCILSNAQVRFRTYVPQDPIVIGQSFQVQYYIEDGENVTEFSAPDFKDFKIVTGPNVYGGSALSSTRMKQSRNYVYTVVPLREGRLPVSGASVMINGRVYQSNSVFVDVISEQAAESKNKNAGISDYYLQPGEDPVEKIRKNLFVDVQVNRKSCFVGEPIIATFKLYSRLESRSDIIKNPGFYGFSVHDMVSLNDKMVVSEMVDGRLFDVHTIRKVQLYPLQAGRYTIDPMEVVNKVEFSRSVVNKKTEQEIIEGIFENNDDGVKNADAEVYESGSSTRPVVVNVKALPVRSKPENFNGAVGRFSISTTTDQDEYAKNEEGFLIITIGGKGNFTQLSAPLIQWPQGVEGFEPMVTDTFDRSSYPLSGSRIFRYAFVSSGQGKHRIAPVSFSYFDIDSNRYKTIASDPVEIIISDKIRKEENIQVSSNGNRKGEPVDWWMAGVTIFIVVASVLGIIAIKRSRPKEETIEEEIKKPTADMSHLAELKNEEGKIFYSELRGVITAYLSEKYSITVNALNRKDISERLLSAGIKENDTNELLSILSVCDTGMFTTVEMDTDRLELIERTEGLLKKI